MKKLLWLLFAGIPLITGVTFADWVPDNTEPLNSTLDGYRTITITNGTATGATDADFLVDGATVVTGTGGPIKDPITVSLAFTDAATAPVQKVVLGNAAIGAINANLPAEAIIDSLWAPDPTYANPSKAIDANTLKVFFEATLKAPFKPSAIERDHEFSATTDAPIYIRATISVNGRFIEGPFVQFAKTSTATVREKKMTAVYAAMGRAIAYRVAWFTGAWTGRSFQIIDSSVLFQRLHGQDATSGTFLGQSTDLIDYTGISTDGTSQLRNVMEKVIKFLKKAMVPIAIMLLAYNGLTVFFAWKDENVINDKLHILTGTMIGFFAMTLAVNLVDWVIFGREGELLRGEVDTADFAMRGVTEVGGIFDMVTSFLAIIAVAFIVFNAIFYITSGANDESKETEIKKRIMFSMLGLLLVISIKPIINTFTVNGQLTMPSITGMIGIAAKWINFTLGFVGIAAVVAIIYGGVKMIAHFGDETQVETAKKIIIAAVTGLVLALSSWVLIYYFIYA